MDNKKCKKCCFRDPDTGECHRFPPTPDGKGTSTHDEFPIVRENGWCGEFKK